MNKHIVLKTLLDCNNPVEFLNKIAIAENLESLISATHVINFNLSDAVKIAVHYFFTLCLQRTPNLKYKYMVFNNNKEITGLFQSLDEAEAHTKTISPTFKHEDAIKYVETEMKYLLRVIFIFVVHGGKNSFSYAEFCEIFDSTPVFGDIPILPEMGEPALDELDYYIEQSRNYSGGFQQLKKGQLEILRQLKEIFNEYKDKISDYPGFQSGSTLITVFSAAMNMGNLSDIEVVRHDGKIGYFYKNHFIPAKKFSDQNFLDKCIISAPYKILQPTKTISSTDFMKMHSSRYLFALDEKIKQRIKNISYSIRLNDEQKQEIIKLKMLTNIIDAVQVNLGHGHAPNINSDELIELMIRSDQTRNWPKKYAEDILVAICQLRGNKKLMRRSGKYKSVQFIGLRVPLGYPLKENGHFSDLGEPNSFARRAFYRGDCDDQVDIRNKLEKLIAAIKLAENNPYLSKDETVLKVFVAPEGFFRGGNGAYDLQNIPQILTQFRVFTGSANYRDWLFMPGTAIGYLEVPPDLSAQLQGESSNQVELFNIALVQRGGYLHPNGKREAIIYKEFFVGGDVLYTANTSEAFNQEPSEEALNPHYRMGLIKGVPRKILSTEGSRDYGGQKNFERSPIERGEPALGGFLTGGCLLKGIEPRLTIGVEVCRDHVVKRLRSMVRTPMGQRPRNLVDMQIVISAGASIRLERVAVKPGGLVFNMDAFRPDGLRMPQKDEPLAAYLAVAKANAEGMPQELQSIAPACLLPLWQDGTVAIFPPQLLPKHNNDD